MSSPHEDIGSAGSAGTRQEDNRDHWNALGASYTQNWATAPQQALSELELRFVTSHVPAAPDQHVLDVGIGNGRILQALCDQPSVVAVHGVDIATEMVQVCQEKFASNSKVKGLTVCDISREPLPVPDGLQFISAIRMLKYNENWWDIVEFKLVPHLAAGGVLVFSMPNAHSVKLLSRPYDIDYFKTTPKDLRRRVEKAGLDLLDMSGFSKAPDVLYRSCRSPILSRALLTAERAVAAAIGRPTLARELFVTVRRRR